MNQDHNQKHLHPKGLTEIQVLELQKKFGKNEVVPSSIQTGLFQFLKFFKDPMGIMMLSLALIYFLLGEKKDALMMLIAFIPVTAVDVILEIKAEKALAALKATFQHTAKVFRDGQLKEIPIQEIVPFDWIALEEGQTIPADGKLHSASHLSVNESSLTGESVPIDKKTQDEIFAGTSILTGHGIYEVQATGRQTKFGKIVDLLELTEDVKSPLQLKVHHLVKQVFKIAFLLVILLFVLEFLRGQSFLESLLIALTFGMASVPEEFPLVFTLYLSLGAWRLSKKGVLVKSLPSVETLGSVNVICTDKTGTLTEGKFQLNDLVPFASLTDLERWKFAILACEPVVIDSMELAIKEKVSSRFVIHDWTLVHDYPFELEGKHMSHAWKHASGETLVAMKGAVEGVLIHCQESQEIKKQILLKTEELSAQGYRLLGLAGKTAPITGLRDKDEEALHFIGILCFSDPIRMTAKNAILVCQQENISVKMITGDHPLTAHSIADQLGLEHSHDALYTGTDLKQMSITDRKNAFVKGSIFSRVTPEQKFEMIQSLKEDGLIVAMTGDGINDAPALKIADIGISMGENATDAARATAKMVLTKSDFHGIVEAITEGRRIFSNLRRSFSYLIAFHIPIVLLSFLPPLLKLGEILKPIHIILLELIVHPVSAFTFENLPHQAKEINLGLINKQMALTSSLAGVLLSLLSLSSFVLFDTFSHEEKRSMAFLTVLFGNIGFIILSSWPSFSRRMLMTIVILFVVSLSIVQLPWLATQLHFTQLPNSQIIWAFIFGLLSSLPSWLLNIRQKFKP